MFDVNDFDFDTMKSATGVDPFAEKTTFALDNRFYKLKANAEGKGSALIRFMPDKNREMMKRIFKINTTFHRGSEKRFVSEYSPNTIGLPCPFHERWQELYNSGDREGAKKFSRNVRYITNIKVLRDPANPENEGKFFLYDLSKTMKEMIEAAMNPSEQDIALGASPRQLFNPLRGNSFRLVVRPGSKTDGSGKPIPDYSGSEVVPDVTGIYQSGQDAMDDIVKNAYCLAEFVEPSAFLSYEKLREKLAWVTFSNPESVTVSHTGLGAAPSSRSAEAVEIQESVPVTPQKKAATIDDLDDLDKLLSGSL